MYAIRSYYVLQPFANGGFGNGFAQRRDFNFGGHRLVSSGLLAATNFITDRQAQCVADQGALFGFVALGQARGGRGAGDAAGIAWAGNLAFGLDQGFLDP